MRISALVDPTISSAQSEQEAIEEFMSTRMTDYPDVSLFYGGKLEDSAESFSKLPAIFALATLMIYSVLAVQFRSYLQPFIILSAIPLGLAGLF